jgi:VWFA-related protein
MEVLVRGIIILLLSALALAQDPTFTASTQLVIQTVTVTTRDGSPVEGLAASDFTVTEDGVPQTIRVFDYQKLTGSAAPREPESIRIYDKLARTRIAPEKTRYKDRRLLALYFDMTAMQPAEHLRSLAAAQSFVRTQMSSADLVAVLRYSGAGVDVLQDFTDDRGRLLSILQTLMIGEGQGFDDSSSGVDTGAAFGQDGAEFNIFNTDRQLSALQTAANMLGVLGEKKALVYFAGGLRLNGLNNQAQLRATVNAAVRAGVSFWPIDSRGLVAEAPLGDATRGPSGAANLYTRFQQSQDTLYSLAADTGGKALLDSNEFERGILDAARSISSYYILGYYSTNPAHDGKLRRIKVSLNNNLPARLDYRQGYFAPKRFSKFTSADKERQLEDALLLPDPITELTIAMEIGYFQMNRAEYFVPVAVKIPGRELALAKRGGYDRTVIDFIGEIKTAHGTTITNLRDKVEARLDQATAAELAKRPVVYDTGFTLLPGEYTIKFLARDAETGRIGTYQTRFQVPNLEKEEQRIPISSVVLGTQRVDLKDALNKVGKNRQDPLVHDGRKLIPSITRVFTRSHTLHVYARAYRNAGPLTAVVTFYGGAGKALETSPLTVPSGALAFDIPLAPLPAGRYTCQLTLLDPAAQKATFWQAPIAIVEGGL